MSHSKPIKEGAIFIADAHFNSNREELVSFLNNIDKDTPQIFLMGDIFDFLAFGIDYFQKKNVELINLLNKLSNKIEIIYFEGNHDFNLQKIFPHIEIITRNNQPHVFMLNKKTILLSHGDLFISNGFELYTKIIRNRIVLWLLNSLDIKHWLTKKIDFWLMQKNIYDEFSDFKALAKKRQSFYKSYKFDVLIEGHFHQGKIEDNYINLPTFTTSKFMQVKKGTFIFCEV